MKCCQISTIAILLTAAVNGAVALAVRGENLLERQNDAQCEKPGVKVTSITSVNDTEALDKRNYNGFCNTAPQTCQLSWRDGQFICTGYCYCLETSACSRDGNYCYYNTGNGLCYCT